MIWQKIKHYLKEKFPIIADKGYFFKKNIRTYISNILNIPDDPSVLNIKNISKIIFNIILNRVEIILSIIKASILSLNPRPADSNGILQIVMLVISELWRDPRVEREARALANAGYQVKILYPDFFSKAYNLGSLDWGKNIIFKPLSDSIFNSSPILTLFNKDFYDEAIKETPFAFHSHDLTTSLVAFLAACKTKSYCICDFHELYSENVIYDFKHKKYIRNPWFKRTICRYIEKIMLKKASSVITVCDSIATHFKKMSSRNRKVSVIRNIPFIFPKAPDMSDNRKRFRKKHDILDNTAVVLYQGGVGPSRLLEPVIESMKYTENAILVIRGPGIEYLREEYMLLADKLNIPNRIICADSVPSDQVVEAAREADIGLWTLPNLSKNFYYALPNKVFEYLAAGIPIVCANFPEVAKIIDRYKVGLTFDPYDPKSIAASINKLCENQKLREEYKKNIVFALQDLKADQEWQKCVNLYRELAQGIPQ